MQTADTPLRLAVSTGPNDPILGYLILPRRRVAAPDGTLNLSVIFFTNDDADDRWDSVSAGRIANHVYLTPSIIMSDDGKAHVYLRAKPAQVQHVVGLPGFEPLLDGSIRRPSAFSSAGA